MNFVEMEGLVMKAKKVCWISAGVSSFMAGVIAGDVDEWIYIDVSDQHPDSIRFIKDCEKAIGIDIKILKSSEYKSVSDCVLSAGAFMNRHNFFAPCTNWLKKRVRKEWEYLNRDYIITYVWGFDANEKNRAARVEYAMPEFYHQFPLIDKNLDKQNVHGLFNSMFNFKRPVMYDLGYPNNNCVGCVKGGMGYWNKIRVDFPDVFNERAKLERVIGNTILKDNGKPLYLDSLDCTRGNMNLEVFPDCGVFCYLANMEVNS